MFTSCHINGQAFYVQILRRMRVTTIAVEKQQVLHILSVYVFVCVALVIHDVQRIP